MLTFSTSEDTKSLKIANVREIAIAYTIRWTGSVSNPKIQKNFEKRYVEQGGGGGSEEEEAKERALECVLYSFKW